MIDYEHLCILIYAQDQWKEKDFERLSEETLTNFLEKAEHADCDVCLTCAVCRANWELFDPENPGEYVQLCEYCEALISYFKEYQKSGDNVLLFSHSKMKLEVLQNFVEYTLKDKKIKKIFVFQHVDWNKKKPKPDVFIEKISHKEIKNSEFISLLKEEKFENTILYEIHKDNYY